MLDRSLVVALAVIAGHAITGRAVAQDAASAKGYPAAPLLSTGTSILGEPIRYPKTGPAHVTAAIVTPRSLSSNRRATRRSCQIVMGISREPAR